MIYYNRVIKMSRIQRIFSKSGIYHVMMRGNEKKNIFIDDEDKNKVLSLIENKKAENNFYLYAYCVMDNHIHLALKEGDEAISKIMKRIFVSYAMYFNRKYKRVGHVFQDRYKSEVVESDRYLLGLIRYIHKNPEKSGIAKWDQYVFSSASDYIASLKSGLVENLEIFGMFAKNIEDGRRAFKEFMNGDSQEQFIDLEDTKEVDETNYEDFILKYLKKNYIKREHITKSQMLDLIHALLKKSNLSQRYIAKVLGVSKENVRKEAIKIASKEPSL
jgi:putative transposase